jgi:hypothetical protein
MQPIKEPVIHKFGVHEDGTPLTKSGRRNKNYMPNATPSNKRKGRPPAAALKKPKGIIGRPKGTATIINEYRDRMLASPKSARVLEAIFDAALDPEHKHQASAWKLVIDRVAPTAAFEQEIIKGGGKSAIQINITGIGASIASSTQDPQDEDPEDDITDATYEVVP